ncbi:MAG: serine--tRNA ligase [Pseudomonadota bacterium]
MFDLKWIRENPDAFDKALAIRGLKPKAQDILQLDENRRQSVTHLQDLQTRRNATSKEIGKAKGQGDETAAKQLMEEVSILKQALNEGEEKQRNTDQQLKEILLGLPNIPLDEIPVGKNESENILIREIGTPKSFSFSPKQHFEIGENLGQMDFETAAKLSGSRFVILKGALAKLERALAAFMIDIHTNEFCYEEIAPPYFVKDEALYGTGQLPKFQDDLYAWQSFNHENIEKTSLMKTEQKFESNEHVKDVISKTCDTYKEAGDFGKEDLLEARLWLIPTGEVPLTNLVREEILNEDALPLRYCAYTPCYRLEAGAAGKDTRGMIRQHQFSKVELVSITHPDKSLDELERMTNCAEEVLKRLDLPYRVMLLCTGDMGFGARKTYDLEVWLPGQSKYREISSCSVCGDFQARRMNTRFRTNENAKNLNFVHTLNGSGLAVGRTIVALLENYQQEDGSVIIPEALQAYMGGQDTISASD